MRNEFIIYKNAFRLKLAPFIDLLEFKKTSLSETEWIDFLNTTKSRIILKPDQFPGRDLPDETIIRQSVEEIFDEFLAAQEPVF
jgi:hypothetical protein